MIQYRAPIQHAQHGKVLDTAQCHARYSAVADTVWWPIQCMKKGNDFWLQILQIECQLARNDNPAGDIWGGEVNVFQILIMLELKNWSISWAFWSLIWQLTSMRVWMSCTTKIKRRNQIYTCQTWLITEKNKSFNSNWEIFLTKGKIIILRRSSTE